MSDPRWANQQAMCDTQHQHERELQVDQEGRVWPCCLTMNVWRFRRSGGIGQENTQPDYVWESFLSTDEWQSALEQDWYFNSLEHHSMSEILEHPMFADTWNWTRLSDTSRGACDICVALCGKWRDEFFGNRQLPVNERNS